MKMSLVTAVAVLLAVFAGLEAGYRIGSNHQYRQDQISAAKMVDALVPTLQHVHGGAR